MLIKNTQPFRKIKLKFISALLLFLVSTAETQAQADTVLSPAAPGENHTWLYMMLFVLTLGLAGAAYWWFNNKAQSGRHLKLPVNAKGYGADRAALDGNKELEWLRKNQQLVGKKNNQSAPVKNEKARQSLKNVPDINQISEPKAISQNEAEQKKSPVDENEKNSPPPLPIFSVNRLELARPFDALPFSNDEDLMSAIEQSYDEFEEDEEVRDLALRVLTAFKTRNAVEAVSQIALYDLSSSLRSKAVNVLSELNHESVFETILLANADPTREVRAAAARSLTKLTFDRADAWTRIAETGEEGRITQSARAAMESGFVDMSFARLVSKDHKQAYEAFTLMALLIKAGETAKIFSHLETIRDMNVQRAILHTIKVTRDQKALDGLYLLLENNTLPVELREEVDRIVEEIGLVAA